jgi:hypothetical protein
MKEPRTEKIVDELKETIARLNKLDSILQKMDVTYNLSRSTRNTPWRLEEIIQRVEYQ